MKQFLKWIIFSVVLALLPLGFVLVKPKFVQDVPVDWQGLIVQGQLLLVTAGFCGTAMGEVISAKRSRELGAASFALVGFTFLVLFAACLTFAEVAVLRSSGQPPTDFVHNLSWGIFIAGLLCSGSCMQIARVDR